MSLGGCPAGFESSDDEDEEFLAFNQVGADEDNPDDFHIKNRNYFRDNLKHGEWKFNNKKKNDFAPMSDLMTNKFLWTKNSFTKRCVDGNSQSNLNFNHTPTSINQIINDQHNIHEVNSFNPTPKPCKHLSDIISENIANMDQRLPLFDPLRRPSNSDSYWFEVLVELFKDNRNNQALMNTEMSKCWKIVPNPFSTTVYFINKSSLLPINQRVKFMNMVMRSLESWKTKTKEILRDSLPGSVNQPSQPTIAITPSAPVNLESLLSKEIKLSAIRTVTSHAVLPDFQLFSSCFELGEEDNPEFINIVHGLIEKHEYIKASRCITALHLHQYFQCNVICLSLLSQGHIAELERYLHDQPGQQVEFLQTIDNFLHKPTLIDQYLGSTDVPRLKRDNLSQKSLYKLGVRLQKLYKADEKTCPHISFVQTCKSIKYLIVKRFLLASAGTNTELQLFLINQLIDQYEISTAVKMATVLNMNPKLLPHQIADDVAVALSKKEHETSICPPAVETESFMKNFHHLSIPRSAIVWVDDANMLDECLKKLKVVVNEVVVGFDTEWRPTFGSSTYNTKISLVQLSTRTHVYLLDVFNLLPTVTEHAWSDFFVDVFTNENRLIVARHAFQFLDLGGVPVQTLDAYCLLELYDVLQLNNSSMMGEMMTERGATVKMDRRSPKYQSKVKLVSDKQALRKEEIIRYTLLNRVPSSALKFVCDSMLIGLGKEMRMCGIDTYIIEADDPHEMAANIAKEEMRILLSSGLACVLMTSNMKADRFYCVESRIIHEQLHEILDKFNIKVTEDDMSSRCQMCNHNKFLKISQTEMKFLWLLKRLMLDLQVPHEFRNVNEQQILDVLDKPLSFSVVDDVSMSSHESDSSMMEVYTFKSTHTTDSPTKMRASIRSRDFKPEDNITKNVKGSSAVIYAKLSNQKTVNAIMGISDAKRKLKKKKSSEAAVAAAANERKLSPASITSRQEMLENFKGISKGLENNMIDLRECDDHCLLDNTAISKAHHSMNGSEFDVSTSHDYRFNDIDLKSFIIGNTQTTIQCEWLPIKRLNEVEEFLVCTGCGKIYWDSVNK
ncbi:hypothetical protein HELRODRAFT_193976 [Helobdella robusta]|uniref:3'-5' exonuclease domain-containing protein n=1 Tax=Helobdella robusta TaxID=6412 RepID=T1FVJ0_HELRO|nr:hypothetical protein HELRODRAFT_193976 [Helobdella robusta]ESN93586.1 hypothetical protein HELRODRAFT_193976 [Helobdella robusta]